MNKRALGITIIVLAGVLFLFIIYILFFRNFNATEEGAVEKKQETITQAQLPKIENEKIEKPAVPAKPRTKEEVTQDDLKRLAMLFAARFGSYSTQSTFQNISDLKMFMSESMKVWADKYVEEQNNKDNGSSVYYGITTDAVTAQVKSFDAKAGLAEIEVGTQRREATGTTNNTTTFGQILHMKFKKEAGAWRVDEARFDDKQTR